MQNIGQRIRKVRRELDLTQKEVADMVGFSPQALSAIEKGDTVEPDKSNLISLARALKNDFGESWLTEYIHQSEISDNKKVIEQLPVEEILSLKFGANPSRRSKSEMKKLRDLLDAELEKMKNET